MDDSAGEAEATGDRHRRELYRVASSPSLSPAEKVERILECGRDRLDVENGHVVSVDADAGRHEVERTVGSDVVEAGTVSDLEDTFCRRTVASDEVLVVEDGRAVEPTLVEEWGIECYVGSPLRVAGDLYGTVCFVDTDSGDGAFGHTERAFVDLAARWIGRLLERRTYERDHHRQRERFDLFVDEVTDYAIFTLDPAGYVTSWNAGAELIKGYRESEILGRHFSTFYTDADRERGLPAALLDRARQVGRAEDEGWRVRKGDSEFWALVSITALYDEDGGLRGFGKVTRDLTERREARRALQAERAFTERTLDALDDFFFVLDADGGVRRVNERVVEVTGYAKPELRSMDVSKLFAADDRDAIRDAIDEGLATGETTVDATLVTADGRHREYEFRAERLTDDDGSVTGLAGIGRDVTERNLYEERLQVAQRVLRHNLRNDLNAIRGWAGVAAEAGTDPDRQAEALDRVRAIADRLSTLSEKTRELASEDVLADRPGTETDVLDRLPALLEGFRSDHPAATVESRLPDVDRLPVVDGEGFETAVVNVVENAIEHNPNPEPWVRVDVEPGAGRVRIRVHDDGPGIPEHERLVLRQGTETPLSHGSGIGLWLAYWSVRTCGGELWFDDRDPTGSTVTLTLPLAK